MTDEKKTNAERLADWIMETGRKRSWVAAQCGVNSSTVTRWCSGDQPPARQSAVMIETITGGAVKAGAW